MPEGEGGVPDSWHRNYPPECHYRQRSGRAPCALCGLTSWEIIVRAGAALLLRTATIRSIGWVAFSRVTFNRLSRGSDHSIFGWQHALPIDYSTIGPTTRCSHRSNVTREKRTHPIDRSAAVVLGMLRYRHRTKEAAEMLAQHLELKGRVLCRHVWPGRALVSDVGVGTEHQISAEALRDRLSQNGFG